MGFLKNKRAVEALPLRYIIIALVAALVIGIALQFVGILKSGTISAATKMNESLSERTACELDMDEPVITINSIVCNATTDKISVTANVKDDCGVADVAFTVDNDTDFTDMQMSSGTDKDGTWRALDIGDYTFGSPIKVFISAFDKSTGDYQGTYYNNSVSCS